MIYRIIGRSGSGKTAYLLEAVKKAHEAGKQCIILTPEQQSISTERTLCALLGGKYNLNIEILNFERLPDRVFRENGGVTRSRADSKTLSLFTAIACEKAKERLLIYEKAAFDREFTKKISGTISRMENCGVTPKDLVGAASLLDEKNNTFKQKLYDIGEIFNEYTILLENGYSDSAGIQKQLYESLLETNFFEGKTVFIDGYYNFTPAEEPIVKQILKGAEDTYITILYDENDKSGIFDVNEKTLSLTDRGGSSPIHASSPRKRSDALGHIEKNLFSQNEPVSSSCDGVSVISCKTPFEESECAAEEIKRLVKSGMRYKDISIAIRDDNRFEGILDNALRRNNIPFYLADKDDLSSKEISSLILSLLEIAQTNWSCSSVLKYINSSYSPLSDKEADNLSIYAEVWGISGKKWYSEEEWILNPSGYKTKFSPREEEMLATVNRGREKLIFALEATVHDLKSRSLTISKAVRVIYNHLIHIKADESLEKRVVALMESGENDKASKLSAVWDNIMSILDTLYETAGDMKITPKRLHDLIKLMMDEYKIGALPSFSDSVEVGNASIMRPSECKAMIVLGANDGVFPSEPETSGLFSDSEKEFLKTAGIESETLPDEHLKSEFLHFYNLCSAPEKELIITYSTSSLSGGGEKPSMFIDSIIRMMGKSCLRRYEKKEVKTSRTTDTFSENVSILPKEPDILNLSASKIEKYLSCPFSYFCDYILFLKNYEKATLNAADAGTYFHRVIELFTKSLFETGSFVGKDDKEISEFCKTAKEEYILQIFKGNSEEREKYAFDKFDVLMFPLLKNINDEFSHGGFIPKEFEASTTAKYPITPKTMAKLRGKADRIDVLEKDGKKYIRVVDYKTGNKAITEKDVENGFEMQMLTYLFSCCGKDETPAGVLYHLCRMPESGKKPFNRNGLMINDENVTEAMAYISEDKRFSKNSFCSDETFSKLKKTVERNIQNVGKNIIDGKMDIAPSTSKKNSPCKYCSFRLYCRKKLKAEETP